MPPKNEPTGSKLPNFPSKAAAVSSSMRPGASFIRPGPSVLRHDISSDYASEVPLDASRISSSKTIGLSSIQESSIPPAYRSKSLQSRAISCSTAKEPLTSSSSQICLGSRTSHPSTHHSNQPIHCPACPDYREEESHQETSVSKPIASQRPSSYSPSSRPLQQSIMASKLDIASQMASRLDAASTFKSMAPSASKSILRSLDDFEFASRQSQYSSLGPKDRKTQDNWAKNQIKLIGACPDGWENWQRRENPGGYQCEKGAHGITDDLLAEGKGGILVLYSKIWGESDGRPYYPDPITGKHVR
jgi:hypothetical protein